MAGVLKSILHETYSRPTLLDVVQAMSQLGNTSLSAIQKQPVEELDGDIHKL